MLTNCRVLRRFGVTGKGSFISKLDKWFTFSGYCHSTAYIYWDMEYTWNRSLFSIEYNVDSFSPFT